MRALQVLLIASQIGACAALALRGLLPKFTALAAFLLFSAVRGVVLSRFSIYDPLYRDVWIATLPFVTLLQIWTATEAYRRSLEELPGVPRHGHWFVAALAAAAAALVQIPQKTYSANGAISLAHQAVGTVLGIAALLIPVYLSFLRPQRRRNIVLHERTLALHFTGMAVLLALVHLGALGWTSVAQGILSIACCVLWMFGLTREGEQLPPTPASQAGADGLTGLRERLKSSLGGDGVR